MTDFPYRLLAQLIQRAPFQPATHFWRAIELTFLVENGLPLAREARAVFDLGCGDGEVMRLLRPHLSPDAVITGIDIDEAEVALAKASGLYQNVLCGSADAVALPDQSQEAVISNSVLEHVAPIEGVLKEAGRLLKTGGYFIATVPAPGFHVCLKGSWRRGVPHDSYCAEMDRRLVHYRYWSQKQWEDYLLQAGIQLVSCTPYLSKAETQRWELLSRLTGGLLYHLTKGRQRPIHIQRKLGVRRAMCLPFWLANAMGRFVTLGLAHPAKTQTEPAACFLVIGRKI